jgi:hypothetical protein
MRQSWLQLFLAFGSAASPARQVAPPARKLTIVGSSRRKQAGE